MSSPMKRTCLHRHRAVLGGVDRSAGTCFSLRSAARLAIVFQCEPSKTKREGQERQSARSSLVVPGPSSIYPAGDERRSALCPQAVSVTRAARRWSALSKIPHPGFLTRAVSEPTGPAGACCIPGGKPGSAAPKAGCRASSCPVLPPSPG